MKITNKTNLYKLVMKNGMIQFGRILKKSSTEESVWIVNNRFVFACEVRSYKKL